MKKGTKKVVISAIKREITRLEFAIESCKKMPHTNHEDHIAKLEKKIMELQEAINEVEAA